MALLRLMRALHVTAHIRFGSMQGDRDHALLRRPLGHCYTSDGSSHSAM